MPHLPMGKIVILFLGLQILICSTIHRYAWAQNDFEPSDVRIVQTGDTIEQHRVGFYPPADPTSLSAYMICYSEAEKAAVVDHLVSLSRAEIDELDSEAINSGRLITNLDWANGGGNRFHTDQVDLLTGAPFTSTGTPYHVYVAALDDSGVLGAESGTPGIGAANMTIGNTLTPEMAMAAVNAAIDAEEVVSILAALKLSGWFDHTAEQQLTVAETIFNQRPYDDLLFFRSQVENEMFIAKAPSGMAAVNATDAAAEIRAALAAIYPPNWNNLSGTAQGTNAPAVMLDQKALAGGQFSDLDQFIAAVRSAVAMGTANDNNYYNRDLHQYVEHFSLINPFDFLLLPLEQRYAAAAVIKYGNGLGDSGLPRLYPQDDPGGFVILLGEMVTSVQSAMEQPLTIDPPQLEVGVTAMLTGALDPEATETRVYFSSDETLANMDVASGAIAPVAAGQVTVGCAIFDTTQRTLTSFGAITDAIVDTVAPVGQIYPPEAGGISALIIWFNEDLHADVTGISDIADLITSIQITGGHQQERIAITSVENSVNWITNRIAKVSFTPVRLYPGNRITIDYSDKVIDRSANQADATVSDAAVADRIRPLGKTLTPAVGTMDSVTVVFSETLSPRTKAISNSGKLIRSIKVLGGASQATVQAQALNWTQIDGREAAIITIAPIEIVPGNYLKVNFTGRVRDLAGNRICNDPAVVPIGGGLAADSDEIYQAVRRTAGGKNPVIAVIGSSRTDLDAALDRFNDLTSGYSAMTLARQGFEPVFIPIAPDNYESAADAPENIALMDQAHATLLMGGSQLRHSRCFLKDDLSDTPLMTAMRSIYASGGAIAGSSAGDHVLGEVMHGGGTSWGDLAQNGMIQNSITDPFLGDDSGQHSGIGPAFGFLAPYEAITDSHFESRGRLGRLIVAMRETGMRLGVGVDDNSAILFKGNHARVYGENGVFIVNAEGADFPMDDQFKADHLRLHYLTSGDRYQLKRDRVVTRKRPILPGNDAPYHSSDVFGAYEIRAILAALVQSRDQSAWGTTAEQDPGFTLTFSKTGRISGFVKEDLHTIRNIMLEVAPN